MLPRAPETPADYSHSPVLHLSDPGSLDSRSVDPTTPQTLLGLILLLAYHLSCVLVFPTLAWLPDG